MTSHQLLVTADGRYFLVDGEPLPGDLLVSGIAGDRRVDPTALAPYEVTRDQAEAHVRRQVREALALTADRLARARRTTTSSDPAVERLVDQVQALLDAMAKGEREDDDGSSRPPLDAIELIGLIERVLSLGHEDVVERGKRIAAEFADDRQPLGRRVDALVERLEREVDAWIGRDRDKRAEQRQAEYKECARSAIADALREAGIEPLNDPRNELR